MGCYISETVVLACNFCIMWSVKLHRLNQSKVSFSINKKIVRLHYLSLIWGICKSKSWLWSKFLYNLKLSYCGETNRNDVRKISILKQSEFCQIGYILYFGAETTLMH